MRALLRDPDDLPAAVRERLEDQLETIAEERAQVRRGDWMSGRDADDLACARAADEWAGREPW